jgi:hypothetical protein
VPVLSCFAAEFVHGASESREVWRQGQRRHPGSSGAALPSEYPLVGTGLCGRRLPLPRACRRQGHDKEAGGPARSELANCVEGLPNFRPGLEGCWIPYSPLVREIELLFRSWQKQKDIVSIPELVSSVRPARPDNYCIRL